MKSRGNTIYIMLPAHKYDGWQLKLVYTVFMEKYIENREVLMLKLSLKPGEYIDIGEDIRIIFSGGSSNNIHLLVVLSKITLKRDEQSFEFIKNRIKIKKIF